MQQQFSTLLDDLFFQTTIARIGIENKKQTDLSHNTMLYRSIICRQSGKHTISSIAKLLSVATTAVTQKVNELEKKGYVIRKHSEQDKRIVYLCSANRPCSCKEAILERDQNVYEQLTKEFTKEQLDNFFSVLTKTLECYKKYDERMD